MFSKPNYKQENKFWKMGMENIAGLDEAGRGAWAGPVVAAAVILSKDNKLKGVNDSKILSLDKRERLFVYIKKNARSVGVGVVANSVIDEYGILQATRKAFLKAVENLGTKPDHLLVDGVRIFDHVVPSDFVVKGDSKIVSISAASIIAKVTRDNILREMHRLYPEYGFDQHKGYGTKLHREMINKHGLSEIHRKSWQPMIDC